VSRAAEATGMDRTQIQHMMAKHQIQASEFRGTG